MAAVWHGADHCAAALECPSWLSRQKVEEIPAGSWSPYLGAAALSAAVLVGACLRRTVLYARELHRPYLFHDVSPGSSGKVDVKVEFMTAVTWIQDTLIRPLDQRMPGNPFKSDLHSFPSTPTVLVLGNHSSGKSTLINQLFGVNAQETGVAPVDDGFTVLERHPRANEFEDGPTLLSCPDNRAFAELRQFGHIFTGHLKRKRLYVPDTAILPFGLQVVDSPGMLDTPTSEETSARARGYNFIDVVRWWSKQADLILFNFDPNKPGTSGETLSVLTQALPGLDHKLLIVLNKADQLDGSTDLARVYATLGWSLSKVIPRKDIPTIYAMHNKGFGAEAPGTRLSQLPFKDFERKRDEVMEEILSVKARHWDNTITALDETLRQTAMVATMTGVVRRRVLMARACGTITLGVLWVVVIAVLQDYCRVQQLSVGAIVVVDVLAAVSCAATVTLLRWYFRQHQQFLFARLDILFEEAYASFFIHTDGEDLRSRWVLVRPKVVNILKSVDSAAALQGIAEWEVARIDECLNQDIPYLRQLARVLRSREQKPERSALVSRGKSGIKSGRQTSDIPPGRQLSDIPTPRRQMTDPKAAGMVPAPAPMVSEPEAENPAGGTLDE